VTAPGRLTSEGASPSIASPTPGTFVALLEPAEWTRLQELGRAVKFPSGSVLMYEREPSDRVMIVLTGQVKTTVLDDGGRETLLSIRDPGDVLGELASIDGQPRSATVTALGPVHALLIAAGTFRTHLETTPRIAVAVLRVVARRFRETTLMRSELSRSDTIGRLAARLVELADRYGQATDDGVVITLALSQEELAAWSAASRAGLANALKTLRELGWIETQRRRVLVRNLEALRTRAASRLD
jgi:CRP/FNR family cyclic AMP-dependent transcriptional regulator